MSYLRPLAWLLMATVLWAAADGAAAPRSYGVNDHAAFVASVAEQLTPIADRLGCPHLIVSAGGSDLGFIIFRGIDNNTLRRLRELYVVFRFSPRVDEALQEMRSELLGELNGIEAGESENAEIGTVTIEDIVRPLGRGLRYSIKGHSGLYVGAGKLWPVGENVVALVDLDSENEQVGDDLKALVWSVEDRVDWGSGP